MLAEDRRSAASESYIAEAAVADSIVTGAAEPDSLTGTVENTVIDSDMFANKLIGLIAADCTQNDAVVTGFEKAVADEYI